MFNDFFLFFVVFDDQADLSVGPVQHKLVVAVIRRVVTDELISWVLQGG